jgi:hypothetical protein
MRRIATLSAVGYESLVDCDMFKWSCGSTTEYSAFLRPISSRPTFAMTSFAFMFVEVPAPPWMEHERAQREQPRALRHERRHGAHDLFAVPLEERRAEPRHAQDRHERDEPALHHAALHGGLGARSEEQERRSRRRKHDDHDRAAHAHASPQLRREAEQDHERDRGQEHQARADRVAARLPLELCAPADHRRGLAERGRPARAAALGQRDRGAAGPDRFARLGGDRRPGRRDRGLADRPAGDPDRHDPGDARRCRRTHPVRVGLSCETPRRSAESLSSATVSRESQKWGPRGPARGGASRRTPRRAPVPRARSRRVRRRAR